MATFPFIMPIMPSIIFGIISIIPCMPADEAGMAGPLDGASGAGGFADGAEAPDGVGDDVAPGTDDAASGWCASLDRAGAGHSMASEASPAITVTELGSRFTARRPLAP